MSEAKPRRPGILCGGNFIVDRIHMIEDWPEQDMLTSITTGSVANGGGPFNVLKDLAAMGAEFPLEATGCVGEDEGGRWIEDDCRAAGIGTEQLHQLSDTPTSYTEVMCVGSTGRRTFFHQRGANAKFGLEHVDFTKSQAGHFHLAYLMLLDELDSPDENGRSRAATLLKRASQAGLTTSVDVVSAESPHFRGNVEEALPEIDYLFINEVEAERATGISILEGGGVSLERGREAVARLHQGGVKQQVILHFPMGAIVQDCSGAVTVAGSLELPDDWIVGSSGAGDAFAAGYLYAIQEGWETNERLKMAFGVAAASLTEASPSGGVQTASECFSLAEKFTTRSL